MNAVKAGIAYSVCVYAIDYLADTGILHYANLYGLAEGDYSNAIGVQLQLAMFLKPPLKLIVAWFICYWLVHRFAIERGHLKSHAPGSMGVVTFLSYTIIRILFAVLDIGPPNFAAPVLVDFICLALLVFFPRWQAPQREAGSDSLKSIDSALRGIRRRGEQENRRDR